MSSAAISVDLREIRRLESAFRDAALTPDDRRNLLRMVATELEDITVERFQTKRDPAGRPWKAISDEHREFLARRFPGAEPPLVMRGDLRDTIESQVNTWEALVGATKVYARVHQEGWPERNLAPRPYLGIGPSDETRLVEIVGDYLGGHLQEAVA